MRNRGFVRTTTRLHEATKGCTLSERNLDGLGIGMIHQGFFHVNDFVERIDLGKNPPELLGERIRHYFLVCPDVLH